MRFVSSFAAAMVALTVAGAAFACGGGSEARFPRQPVFVEPDPVFIDREPESPELVRARQLEAAADRKMMQVNTDNRKASTLRMQARRLRMMARQIDGPERFNLELTAGKLSFRAKQASRRANQRMRQVRQLRRQARQLRMGRTNTTRRMMRRQPRSRVFTRI